MIASAQRPAAADRLVASEIEAQLGQTHRASLKRLSVSVQGGEVTLRGSVSSFYEKQIAIQACRASSRIDRLIDAVEVATGS